MLFLVGTKETQGKRKNDFSWTTDGEPVMYGSECDGEKVDGKWRERPDKRHNADYVHASIECVDNREGATKFLRCKKLNMDTENVAHMVPWVEPSKLSYMQD